MGPVAGMYLATYLRGRPPEELLDFMDAELAGRWRCDFRRLYLRGAQAPLLVVGGRQTSWSCVSNLYFKVGQVAGSVEVGRVYVEGELLPDANPEAAFMLHSICGG